MKTTTTFAHAKARLALAALLAATAAFPLPAAAFVPDEPATVLRIQSARTEFVGQGRRHLLESPAATFIVSPRADSGLHLEVNGSAGTWYVDIAAAGGGPLVPGTYPAVARFGIHGAGTGIAVVGQGRACNTVTGRLVVHEADYYPDGNFRRLAADVEQRCDGLLPPLLAEVRINSAVRFSLARPAGGDEDGDGVPNAVEESLGLVVGVKDNDIYADPVLFARQQFRDFLGREGDGGGIDFWASRIESGNMTRGQVIEAFFSSLEFQGNVSRIARLYLACFLRLPDYAGLQFWAGQSRTGRYYLEIADDFVRSPEFATRYGGTLSSTQFVTLAYQNVLGHAPDAVGLAFWTAELDSGRRTRGQVMLDFSESVEFRNLTASTVQATLMYMAMLRRAPDNGGLAYWVASLDAGSPTFALVNGFLAAPEYRTRFLP